MLVINILKITMIEEQNLPPHHIYIYVFLPSQRFQSFSGSVPITVARTIIKCLLLVYFFHSIYSIKSKGSCMEL